MLDTIKDNVYNKFSLGRIGSSAPVLVDSPSIPNVSKHFRVNHFLLKPMRELNLRFSPNVPVGLMPILDTCMRYAYVNRLPIKGRYAYLTFDQGWVEAGNTLRAGGWHVDGLQGDEVPVKREGDYCFMISDVLPTEFYTGPMNLSDCNMSTDNIFKRLDERVVNVEKNSIRTEANKLYLFDYAAIHRGTPAKQRTYRRLLRLHFTEVPITSVKMTINPDIKYDYEIHTTDGNIPANLK